jgi:predicted  nucleic acid-binding Zn-ribbon protein
MSCGVVLWDRAVKAKDMQTEQLEEKISQLEARIREMQERLEKLEALERADHADLEKIKGTVSGHTQRVTVGL